MNKKFIIPLSLLLIFAVIVFACTKGDGGDKRGKNLETTGIIEVTEVDVSPEISEKIEWLCCREGDIVKMGMRLIRLDRQKLMARLNEGKAMLRGAEARYKASEADLENAMARVDHARAEVKAAEFEVEKTRVLYTEAQDNFQRISELFRQGYAAKKNMDAAKALYDSTSAQFNASVAKKQSVEADLIAALVGIKAADALLTTARAGIGEAEARINIIETELKDTEIHSPLMGVIAYKYFEEGEMVSPGKAIYTIFDLNNIWARVDVEETYIGRIRLGERVIIISGGQPGRNFDGEVIEIGREAEFATQRDVTRGRQDIKTFRVKVAVKNHEGVLKPGMTVMVRFLDSRPLKNPD